MIGYIKSKFGYCYYEIKKEYTHIYNLFVYPEYRRQGKAREMLQLAINAIRREGCNGEIQIVADPKEGNISKEKLKTFYKSMGLKVFDYYG